MQTARISRRALAQWAPVALVSFSRVSPPRNARRRSQIMDKHLEPHLPASLRTTMIKSATAFLLAGVLVVSASAAKPKPKASPKPALSPAELPSPSSSTNKTDMTANPLLTESTLPYNLPPFDKIKDEHFQPALEQGMAEEEKEADAIAKQAEPASFDNTIVAMEKSGELLGRARRV